MGENQQKSQIDPVSGIGPIINSFQFFGLWPMDHANNSRYLIYAFLMQLFSTYFCAATFIAELLKITSVIDSMEYIFIVFSEIMYVLKVTGIIINRKKIYEIINMMRENLNSDSDDEEEQEMIKKGVRRAKNIYYLLLTNFLIAFSFANIGVIFKRERALLFQAAFPYDFRSNTFLYIVTLLYQSSAVLIQAILDAGVDALPSAIIVILNGYCEALGYNLAKLGKYQDLNLHYRQLNEQANIKRLAIKYMKLQK